MGPHSFIRKRRAETSPFPQNAEAPATEYQYTGFLRAHLEGALPKSRLQCREGEAPDEPCFAGDFCPTMAREDARPTLALPEMIWATNAARSSQGAPVFSSITAATSCVNAQRVRATALLPTLFHDRSGSDFLGSLAITPGSLSRSLDVFVLELLLLLAPRRCFLPGISHFFPPLNGFHCKIESLSPDIRREGFSARRAVREPALQLLISAAVE